MKTSRTSQSTGGKNPAAAPGPSIKIAHNYGVHAQGWKPSKHAKGKAKPK